MTAWQITKISLIAAALMGLFLWLATPVYADEQSDPCMEVSEFERLANERGVKFKRVEGARFQDFLAETIERFGLPPSGKFPVAAFVTQDPRGAVVFFISKDDDICDTVTITPAAAHRLINTALSTPI